MFVGNKKKPWPTFASLVEYECTEKGCNSSSFFHMGLPLRIQQYIRGKCPLLWRPNMQWAFSHIHPKRCKTRETGAWADNRNLSGNIGLSATWSNEFAPSASSNRAGGTLDTGSKPVLRPRAPHRDRGQVRLGSEVIRFILYCIEIQYNTMTPPPT